MKKIKKYVLLFTVGLAIMACSNYTDGINESPNSFTSAPGKLILGQAQLEVVKLSSSGASRYAGIFTDQFTGDDRQYINVNDYSMTTGDFDDDWDDLYVAGGAQARLAAEAGDQAGDQLLFGVAKIMEALVMGEAAALWGDVPYSKAFNYTENPNPEYDSQASVLSAVQGLLDEAIASVGTSTVAAVYGTPIFVGNSATWKQVAYSLKARYYLVAKDYANALSSAKQGISAATGDLLSSHTTADGSENMYWQFIVEQRVGYLTANGSNLLKLMNGMRARLLATPGDVQRLAVGYLTANGSNLLKLMNGTRARLLATPGDVQRLAVYFETNQTLGGIVPKVSTGGYFAQVASFPIVSFVETKLIEAEAAARTGGDGLTPFNAVRAYLATKYEGSFPASDATGESLVNQILEEKYISLPGSLQVFHDARRTKNVLGIPVKGTGNPTIPQRFLYPQLEIGANANFPGVVDLFEPTPVNK